MRENNTRPNILANGTPLFCDLYHLTMAQAWFMDGKAEETKTSEAFFRKCPFGGSYLIATGQAEFAQWLKNWRFEKEDIDYLRTVMNPNGKPKFNDDFLQFLEGQKPHINIRTVREGEIVFPNEPVYSVSGPCWQVDLVEAALLNIFNSQSLIATKASRMAYAASLDGKKRPLLEFGLRRAQELGCFSQTRAAFIGGSAGTSNTAAAKHYKIPASGTMAHSFIMSYENELDAFKAYMRASEGNTILLVDTYDTREGVKNAIRASRETGVDLMGIRIDSGDLAYWGKEARRILDEADMPYVKLVASNDLDEHLIENLVMVQKAPYDIFAAGTKLVTAYDTPALGGVFKTKSYMGEPKIKIAEGKTTIPGATDILRIVREGKFEGDIIVRADVQDILDGTQLARDVTSYTLGSPNGAKVIFPKGTTATPLLQTIMQNGKFTYQPETNLQFLQYEAERNLLMLDNSYKRLSNPHIYGVGLESSLYGIQQNLIKAHQGR
ncbi:MAG: nicotinate phosphoribosyltransferase [Acetobacter sp.]|nr:nicotinate phosphoribosyltransferase [Acetobacter sp.]